MAEFSKSKLQAIKVSSIGDALISLFKSGYTDGTGDYLETATNKRT